MGCLRAMREREELKVSIVIVILLVPVTEKGISSSVNFAFMRLASIGSYVTYTSVHLSILYVYFFSALKCQCLSHVEILIKYRDMSHFPADLSIFFSVNMHIYPVILQYCSKPYQFSRRIFFSKDVYHYS